MWQQKLQTNRINTEYLPNEFILIENVELRSEWFFSAHLRKNIDENIDGELTQNNLELKRRYAIAVDQ